jgi:hypothetical protein
MAAGTYSLGSSRLKPWLILLSDNLTCSSRIIERQGGVFGGEEMGPWHDVCRIATTSLRIARRHLISRIRQIPFAFSPRSPHRCCQIVADLQG